jgi:hypothetical protein
MKDKKPQEQPHPKKGFEFTGWATFNWGICHDQVFPRKRDAIEWCVEHAASGHTTWKEAKAYYKVVKVKCVVI